MPLIERLLVRLDHPLLAALLRVLVGLSVVPAWRVLTGGSAPGWTLFLFFLTVLASLRVVPAVLRKLVRVNPSLSGKWADRRRMAKLFDSYQWRKLFWMGLGLGAYFLIDGRPTGALPVLMWLTMLSGLLGQIIWRHRASRLPPGTPPRPTAVTPTHGLTSPGTTVRSETGVQAGSNA